MSSPSISTVILGSLILRPELIQSTEDLGPELFWDEREKKVFQLISEIWESERPKEIDPVILTARLGENGAATFVSSLYTGLHHLSPKTFERQVAELRKKRLWEQIVQNSRAIGETHLKTGTFDEDGFRRLVGLVEQQREVQGKADIRESLQSGSQLQALEIHIEYTVEGLIPAGAITLLHGPGGIGKSFFALSMAGAISRGEPFLGLRTKQRSVVYIDLENPLSLVVERIRRLDVKDVLFWHLSAATPPPKLDSAAYKMFQQLPAGAFVIFDTLRAAHDGDENSSQDMGLVMGRLKELRERGFDIVLIHHVSKLDERTYKGSTAISDLADHVLKLYRARRGSLAELRDDVGADPDARFVLATAKTRFEPFHLYLSFDPRAEGFRKADDPHLEALEAIAEYIAGPGRGQNQVQIVSWARESLSPGRKESFLALLKRGETEGRWRSQKFGNRRIYEPANRP